MALVTSVVWIILFAWLVLAAVVPLGATGWLGTELVYRHWVGVQAR